MAAAEEGQPRRAHRGTNVDGMRVADNVQTNGKGFRIPVTLRECSVVIVGSTCKICGRDFKCESDVALHTRWRHNAAIGSLMDILDREMNLRGIGRKCDVCDMAFGVVSDLRIHKRLIHRQRIRNRGKRRRETVRVKFKLNGVTTTDVSLDRRYIELPNSLGYYVDVCTRASDSLENERRRDDCAENIDLSLSNRIVNKSHMQHGIRPHKAANRYIVGKFASTEDDAIARRTVVGKNLVEISNTSHKNAIPDSDGLCRETPKDRCYLASQKTATDVFIKTFTDSIDVRDKENSRRTNEQEKKNIYYQSEILLDDDNIKVFPACQPEMSDKPSPMSEQNSRSSRSPHYFVRWSDEVAGTKKTAGLTNSLIDSQTVERIINNEKSHGPDRNATKRLSPPLSRLNGKIDSIKTNSNVDDDVQEVLRITRGNAQNDINHESPNRFEREILQNAISDTFTLPSQVESTVHPEKCNGEFTNFEPSDYSSFVTVTESDYQFLANSFDKKLGIYLDLHHYGIKLYNDLPEINNNLEEYSVYAHQNFYETWRQSGELQYANELKANDNEVAVVLD